MTWVPPFFICGECGGEIGRWPVVNLLRQEVLDWRHRGTPVGVAPHRAVLGTPVASLPAPLGEIECRTCGYDEANHRKEAHLYDPADPAVVEEAPVEIPAPEVPARPATHDELPRSAANLDKVAATHGWESDAWYMRGPRMDHRWREWRLEEAVVLRWRRDGHGLVAVWTSPAWTADWSFEEGWSLTHHVEPVSSPELRKHLTTPRMICEACGEPPALHVLTQDGSVCHADPDTDN